MKQLIFATGNANKVKELQSLIEHLDIEVLTLNNYPQFVMPAETGNTFRENAKIKAQAAMAHAKLPALADDSGLTVTALKGEPGIYSARYSGENATAQTNNEKLLAALKDVADSQRQGAFRSVLALVLPDGREYFTEGKVEGIILKEYRGNNGFGYDPLFYLPHLKKTMAELSLEEKNKISHRGKAFRDIVGILESIFTNS